jgi:ankyrin repeat protein
MTLTQQQYFNNQLDIINYLIKSKNNSDENIMINNIKDKEFSLRMLISSINSLNPQFVKIVKLLLDAGAIISVQYKYNGNTSLHYAMINKSINISIIQLLINWMKYNEINIRNNNNDTALDYAIVTNNVKAVELLIEARAEVNIINNLGMMPLIYAARQSNLEIFSFLLESWCRY